MRIVGGRHRGHRLLAPKGRTSRPTSERVREALFNILGAQVVGARVADCFAGTGAMGLEALSRGAAHVTFYESHRMARRSIASNVAALGVTDAATIVIGPLPKSLREGPAFDLVLADPPWSKGLGLPVIKRLVELGRVGAHTVVIVEERHGDQPDADMWAAVGLAITDTRRYGDTALQWLTPAPA